MSDLFHGRPIACFVARPFARPAGLLALLASTVGAQPALAQHVGVGTATPGERLDVVGGNIRIKDAGRSLIFPDGSSQSTAATGATGTGFVQNAPAAAQAGSFNLTGSGTLGGTLIVDNANTNTGTTANMLRFGSSGGEGIGSKRNAGGNQFGLDFYTGSINRFSISNAGRVGIGVASPNTRLSISPSATEPKITLYDGGSTSSHYGFGVSGGQLNYEVDGSGASHVFWAGGKNGTGTELLRVLGNGNVGIGTSSPRGRLDVAASGDVYLVADPANGNTQSLYLPGHLYLAPYDGTAGVAYLQARVPSPSPSTYLSLVLRTTNAGVVRDALTLNPNGSATFYGSVTANGVTLTSDARFKTQVRPLSGSLASVLALRGVRYRWNALGVLHGGQAGAGQIGLLAQEVEAIYPELVATDAQGYKSVNYAQLTPVLIEALKEQQRQIEALQAKAAQAEADHASLLSLQAQLARLLSGELAPAATQARR